MTAIRVDVDEVAALGESLLELSRFLSRSLSQLQAPSVEGRAMGRGSAGGALDAVLSDWELRRHQLCGHLEELGQLARTAGVAYVSAEGAVERLAGVAEP
jgi:hypothetical protein